MMFSYDRTLKDRGIKIDIPRNNYGSYYNMFLQLFPKLKL